MQGPSGSGVGFGAVGMGMGVSVQGAGASMGSGQGDSLGAAMGLSGGGVPPTGFNFGHAIGMGRPQQCWPSSVMPVFNFRFPQYFRRGACSGLGLLCAVFWDARDLQGMM